MTTALHKAVEIAGGQSALARAIGGTIKQAHVWYWLNTDGAKVPPEHCAAIEKATAGRITRHDLRPDVFGALEKTAAQPR